MRLAAQAEKAERQRRSSEEAEEANANILRTARHDVLGGLAGLARLVPGVQALAARINEILVRGTDAKGDPLNIEPVEALRVLGRFGASTRGLVEAANSLIAIERLRAEQPTSILGIQVGTATTEEAEAEMRIATMALAKAKQLRAVVDSGPPRVGGRAGPSGRGGPVHDAELEEDEDAI